jgi:hypothetical protein
MTSDFGLLLSSWCRGLTERHTNDKQGQQGKVNFFHSRSLQDRTSLLASEATGDLLALPTLLDCFQTEISLFKTALVAATSLLKSSIA